MAAMATSAQLPAGDRVLGPGTVSSNCSNRFSTGGDMKFDTGGQIFNPKTGRNVPLPSPTIPAGQHLVRQACTVGGDQDNIRVYYVMTLSTPSTGLQPESKTTSIVAFDPFAQGIPQTVPWPADEDVSASYEIAPTYYGFIARHNLGQGLVGFDGKSLQPSFRSNDRIDTVNFAGYDAFGPAPEGKQTEVFHSAKDGTEVGRNTHHLQASQAAVALRDGIIVTIGDAWPNIYGYFDFKTNQLKQPIASGGDMWGDILTSWSGKNNIGGHQSFIEVRDMSENNLLFSRYGADFDGLHIKHLYFAGKYLYIENDSDSPVIDITNSAKVASGWNVRPTDVINRDWIFVLKGHVAGDTSACFGVDGHYGCSEDGGTLVYAPGGNYSGPWY